MIPALRALLGALALLAPVARAATYLVPPDAEMIQRADDIVVATAIGSRVERDARGAIVTRNVLRVERSLKGDSATGAHLTLTEQGGVLDGMARVIGGSPVYEAGKKYLVFTDRTREPATYGMALGQFFLLEVDRRAVAVRAGVAGFDGNFEPHAERPRDLSRFETYIRGVVAHRYAPADYFIAADGAQADAMKVATHAGFTRASYLLAGNYRWQTPSATFVLSGGRPRGQPPLEIPAAAAEAVGVAAGTWSGAGAGITYAVGGVDHAALGGLLIFDDQNAVLFGDPNREVAAAGALAIGGAWGSTENTYTIGDETFVAILGVDVVLGAGLDTCLGTILTHEMGHTLGLRHANQTPEQTPCTPGGAIECTSDAIMTSHLGGELCTRNGALKSYDSDAVNTVYGAGPACVPPGITIDTQPSDVTIPAGTNASLSIGVGSGIAVKWYRGAVGDRTQEVGSTAEVIVGPLTETTQFWAEVTNTCGSLASRQVTVTVEQATTTNLFMLGGRFDVQVRYRNQFASPPAEGWLAGRSLQASPLSDTAIFWFDSPLVVELMVRVSDARPFDDAFHVYFGGLSDVELFITVKDTQTGKSVEYHKKANELVGQIDRKSFPAEGNGNMLDSLVARAVRPMLGTHADTSTLRVLSRYDVRIRYRNQFASPVGEGYLLGRSIASSETTDTAVFYFEKPESVEWMVRFSDVRPFAERVDFFHGGLSDVEFTIEVTDTRTGLAKEYPVLPFSLKGGVDRQSFQP